MVEGLKERRKLLFVEWSVSSLAAMQQHSLVNLGTHIPSPAIIHVIMCEDQ